jgi:hypothetical protein
MTHWQECMTVGERLKLVKETVEESCPSAAEDEMAFRTAVVLFAAMSEGPNVENLRALTGYPPEFVAAISFCARNAGLWVGERVCYENWFEEDSVNPLAILLDVMVAGGQMIRCKDEDGQILYKAVRPS